MSPLSCAYLLLASLAAAGDTPVRRTLADAADVDVRARTLEDARDQAGRPFTGGAEMVTFVDEQGQVRRGTPLVKGSVRPVGARDGPPAPQSGPDKTKLNHELILGGAAVLGGLQGYLSAGLIGAAAGAGLGLAAAWLFHKGDYGGAFGVTAGAIVGTAIAGPLGGVVGAVVGGLVGHFLGKLFL